MSEATPKRERILLLDSLRGFALMGLFLVHMVEYFELYWYKPEQSIFNDITFFLFGGKAYAVFAMLFGVSFFILMNNNERRGIDFRVRFAWRLVILLLFGFLHGLIYGGDILIILAVTGFFLIPLYKLSSKWVLIISAVFLLHIPEWFYFNIYFENGMTQNPAHWALFGPVLNAYANGSFTELISTTLWGSQLAKWSFMLESGRLSTIFGISILGFYLGRIEFFREYSKYGSKLWCLFISLLSVSILLTAFRAEVTSVIPHSDDWLISGITGSYYDMLYTFTGILFFVLMFGLELPQKVMKLLAPAGKMSLTVYISQSLIFVPFFYGFGFGAYDFIGQTWSFFLGISLWVIQVGLASYWNNSYYYGPMEWLWRALTFLDFNISFRKAKAI